MAIDGSGFRFESNEVGATAPGRPSGRMSAPRIGLVYALGAVAGALLFFLAFAAVFNGVWTLLIAFVVSFGPVGAAGVRWGSVSPSRMSAAVMAPAAWWLSWLSPASIAEAGLLRALLWPGLAGAMFGCCWIGGRLASAAAARSPLFRDPE